MLRVRVGAIWESVAQVAQTFPCNPITSGGAALSSFAHVLSSRAHALEPIRAWKARAAIAVTRVASADVKNEIAGPWIGVSSEILQLTSNDSRLITI